MGNCQLKQCGLRLGAIPRFRYILLSSEKNEINKMMQNNSLQELRLRKLPLHKHFPLHEIQLNALLISFLTAPSFHHHTKLLQLTANYHISHWREIFVRLELETTMFLTNL